MDLSEINFKDKLPQNEIDIKAILNWVYAIMGIVAVIGIIFGAVVWTTSQGDPAKTKKGRDAVLYSVIGLFIVVFAVVITNFVVGAASGQ
ncbi:hypothetical protein IKG48_01330 [Candidatus Saccharibacteria bacterium]|nr:hypothetical protein [Candidatus Saccharibacteria bacterium]